MQKIADLNKQKIIWIVEKKFPLENVLIVDLKVTQPFNANIKTTKCTEKIQLLIAQVHEKVGQVVAALYQNINAGDEDEVPKVNLGIVDEIEKDKKVLAYQERKIKIDEIDTTLGEITKVGEEIGVILDRREGVVPGIVVEEDLL